MVRKSYTPEQIINKLREAEILLNQGNTLPVVWKKIGGQVNGITIDRINPKLGYQIDNIIFACRRCNMIKGDWFSEKQMLEIASIYLRS